MTAERQLRLADTTDAATGTSETATQAIERIMSETRNQVSWHTPKAVRPDYSKVFNQADLEEKMRELPKGSKLYVLISPSVSTRYRLAYDYESNGVEEWAVNLPEGGSRMMRFISEGYTSSDPFIEENGGKVFEIIKGEEAVISKTYGTKTDWYINLGNGFEPFRNLNAVERWGKVANLTASKSEGESLE